MTKRRVVILGGADFIGARLAEALGASVEFQPLLVGRVSSLGSAGYESINGDITQAATLRKVIVEDCIVVNCVVSSPAHMTQSAEALFSHITGFRELSVLQLSTFAAYGSTEGLVTEEAALRGDVDAYAAARASVDRMAETYGAIRIRPGIIYGPGSQRWSGQIGRLLMARRLGDLGVAGDGICNLLFIEDLINVMVRLVKQPGLASGALNLCGDERMTWNEYFLRYAKALGAVPVRRLTRRRLRIEAKLLAPPLKIGSLLTAGRIPWPELISPSLLRVCAQHILLDNRKAEHLLKPIWTPMAVGLQAAAEWYKVHYARR